jgi:hypothetical protein
MKGWIALQRHRPESSATIPTVAGVGDDGLELGLKRRHVLKHRQFLPGPCQNILRQVFCCLQITRSQKGKCPHYRPIVSSQHIERFDIACLCASDESRRPLPFFKILRMVHSIIDAPNHENLRNQRIFSNLE